MSILPIHPTFPFHSFTFPCFTIFYLLIYIYLIPGKIDNISTSFTFYFHHVHFHSNIHIYFTLKLATISIPIQFPFAVMLHVQFQSRPHVSFFIPVLFLPLPSIPSCASPWCGSEMDSCYLWFCVGIGGIYLIPAYPSIAHWVAAFMQFVA